MKVLACVPTQIKKRPKKGWEFVTTKSKTGEKRSEGGTKRGPVRDPWNSGPYL